MTVLARRRLRSADGGDLVRVGAPAPGQQQQRLDAVEGRHPERPSAPHSLQQPNPLMRVQRVYPSSVANARRRAQRQPGPCHPGDARGRHRAQQHRHRVRDLLRPWTPELGREQRRRQRLHALAYDAALR